MLLTFEENLVVIIFWSLWLLLVSLVGWAFCSLYSWRQARKEAEDWNRDIRRILKRSKERPGLGGSRVGSR